MPRKQQVDELRALSVDELYRALREARTDRFQNRFRYATRTLDNPAPLRQGKKRIARILTLIGEKEREQA